MAAVENPLQTFKRKMAPEHMPRSRSSVLAFKLREFLDSQREQAAQAFRKPFEAVQNQPVQQLPQTPLPLPLPPPPPSNTEEMVWVDAFFYGFYIEKSKAVLYQAALQKEKSPAARAAALVVPQRR